MDLKGLQFGRWNVLEFSHKVGNHQYWLCQCECGTIKPVRQQNLLNGRSNSCGCLHHELAKSIGERSKTHGDFGTKLYGVWNGMKTRCKNPNHKYYSCYGGRGIKVCDDWEEYINFKKWAIKSGYRDGLSIERVDVDGNYEPSNCIWIPLSEQNKNKRNTRLINYQGKDYTIDEIAEITGLKRRTIAGRYERGWSAEQLFNTELKKEPILK